jgi:hypothetical protein
LREKRKEEEKNYNDKNFYLKIGRILTKFLDYKQIISLIYYQKIQNSTFKIKIIPSTKEYQELFFFFSSKIDNTP